MTSLRMAVAFVGLVGVLGGARFASGTENPAPKTAVPAPAGDVVATPQDAPAAGWTLAEARHQAERQLRRWLEAWQAGDVATMVELSPCPFYLNSRMVTSAAELEAAYREMVDPAKSATFTIDHLLSGTIGALRREGLVPAGDRMLSTVDLDDDDLAVILTASNQTLRDEKAIFYFRRLDDRVEMAGFWD